MNRILLSSAVVALALAVPARAQSLDDGDGEWVQWSGPSSSASVISEAPVTVDAAPDVEDGVPVADLEAAEEDVAEPAAEEAEWNVAAEDSQWSAQPPPPPLPDATQPAAQAASPQLVEPAVQPTQHDFEATLSQYGTWVNEPRLGWVWQPSSAVVGDDFVPYVTNGSWSYCSSGWGFRSQWSWGWAPFHYGRWYQHATYGWVWWPSYTWAPAWVDWRYGGGYVAWAPLPPPGFSLGFGVRVPGWSYAPYRSFHRPSIASYVVRPQYGATWGNRNGWGWARGGSTWHGSAPIGGEAHHSDGLSSAGTRSWSAPRTGGWSGSRGWAGGARSSGWSGSHGWSGGSRSGGSFGSHGFSGGGHSGGGFDGGGGGHRR